LIQYLRKGAPSDRGAFPRFSEISGTFSSYKIVKVAEGVANDSACDGTDATHLEVYSTPPSTLCIKSK
jgi:hypothetical protein